MPQPASDVSNTSSLYPTKSVLRRLDLTNLALLLLACILVIALLTDLNLLQPSAGASQPTNSTDKSSVTSPATPQPAPRQDSLNGDY